MRDESAQLQCIFHLNVITETYMIIQRHQSSLNLRTIIKDGTLTVMSFMAVLASVFSRVTVLQLNVTKVLSVVWSSGHFEFDYFEVMLIIILILLMLGFINIVECLPEYFAGVTFQLRALKWLGSLAFDLLSHNRNVWIPVILNVFALLLTWVRCFLS